MPKIQNISLYEVWESLPSDKDNAVTADEIAEQLGYSYAGDLENTSRFIATVISQKCTELVKLGFPAIGCRKGFYRASPEQIRERIRFYEGRAKTTQERVQNLTILHATLSGIEEVLPM